MEKEESFKPTEISTRDNGEMTRPMAMATTNTWMELDTAATGRMTDNMDTEWKLGRIMPSMRGTTNTE